MQSFYENRSHIHEDHIPLSIYQQKNFIFRAHWHPELEMVYVKSGRIWVSVNNEGRELRKNDIALTTSGDIHYYERTSVDSEIIILVFKPDFFGITSEQLGNRRIISHFFQNQDKIGNEIKLILEAILIERSTKNDFYELFIKAKILELFASILRHCSFAEQNEGKTDVDFSEKKALQAVLAYIENNFTEELSLKLLADNFNLDPFNLSKSFNAVTGMNLRTYINTLRVLKAESLIRNSRKPLIEIAFECGFNSVRTFNRAFKALTGKTPSTIRAKTIQG